MEPNGDAKMLAEWFWTDRWMGSSAFLLPIAPRGLYREMLTQAWRRGARLPNNHETIRRACGVTEKEWRQCWPYVQAYWRVDGDDLVNDTQLSVYAEAVAKQVKASTRGAKGAAKRWAPKSESNAQGDAQASTQTHAQGIASVSDLRSKNVHTQIARAREDEPAPTAEAALAKRAGRFIDRFSELFKQERGGAHYMGRPAHDWQRALDIVATWPDDDWLEKLVIVFLNSDHKFIAESTRSIPVFASRASWCDDRLREGLRREGRKVS